LRSWAWKWSRCGRRWGRPERTTRDCWAICGPSRRIIEMKIPINPASEPFRRDRAMLVASGTVALLLVVSLGVLILLANADNAQLADLRKDVGNLRGQIATASREQSQAEAVIRKPENAQ